MTARQVHAILAAGVENPELIARWRRDPRPLLDHGVEPGSIDLAALWMFAGLTVKVRHNGIREDFPLTFRLMNVAGLDIEVFASYAAFRASAGEQYATTTEARARDLIIFLEHWLDLDRTDHPLLWDLIRHEQALARLSKSALMHRGPAAADAGTPSQGKPTGKSVPKICGEIVLHEMQCDPRAVGLTLRESVPLLNRIPLATRYFCYWRADGAQKIQILELDAFGYYALSFVDGTRSTADLSRELGGNCRPTRGFLRSLGELAAVGILGFGSPSSSRAEVR